MSHSKPLVAATATALLIAAGLAHAQATSNPPSAAGTQAQAPAAKDSAAIETAFSKADADRDTKLTKKELAAMPEILAKFDVLDKNKDGVLSLQEFAAGMKA